MPEPSVLNDPQAEHMLTEARDMRARALSMASGAAQTFRRAEASQARALAITHSAAMILSRITTLDRPARDVEGVVDAQTPGVNRVGRAKKAKRALRRWPKRPFRLVGRQGLEPWTR